MAQGSSAVKIIEAVELLKKHVDARKLKDRLK